MFSIDNEEVMNWTEVPSLSYNACKLAKHIRFRLSPNGIDLIEECEKCHARWLLKADGYIIKLEHYLGCCFCKAEAGK